MPDPAPSTPPEAVVAGHICLDVIPRFGAGAAGLDALLVPGALVEVGAPLVSTGGAVSNTGLALHRLGVSTRLMGQVGRDLFGGAILDLLRATDERLAEGMIVSDDASSSYTVVLNPPGVDRVFLHSPGANDTFHPRDLPLERIAGARVFHFGYPPLMRRTYADGGEALASRLAGIRAAGTLVSLDMSRPDPSAPAGQVDWAAWLERVLPHVDLFCPSIDELLFMLDRPRFDRLAPDAPLSAHVDGSVLADLSDRLLALGVRAAALKLGAEGLYLRTASDAPRMACLGDAVSWSGRELLMPCFAVTVAGTTGAGDATIAGLLAALLRGLGPEDALRTAVAVGACSVERPDATGGIPPWPAVRARIRSGWPRRPVALPLPGWTTATDLRIGPHDASSQPNHHPNPPPTPLVIPSGGPPRGPESRDLTG